MTNKNRSKKKKIKKEIRFKIKNYFYTFFKAHFTYFLSLLYKIESFKKKLILNIF